MAPVPLREVVAILETDIHGAEKMSIKGDKHRQGVDWEAWKNAPYWKYNGPDAEPETLFDVPAQIDPELYPWRLSNDRPNTAGYVKPEENVNI